MNDTSIERRADYEVRQAINSIEKRYLNRVGDRVARGLTQRELGEELITEVLQLFHARYGCLLRLSNWETASNTTDVMPRVSLDAVVSMNSAGLPSRQHDTLLNCRADELLLDVIDTGKAVFSNDTKKPLSLNLPAGHPQVERYALLPIREKKCLRALLFIANTDTQLDVIQVNRLQLMLDAFMRVHLSSIVHRGIREVIADNNDISRQLLRLTDACFNGVLSLDERGTIVSLNPPCEQMFGVATGQALGSLIAVFLPTEVVDRIKSSAAQYAASILSADEKPSNIQDVKARCIDGHEFTVDISLFHHRVKRSVSTTLVFSDVSARLELARKQQQAIVQYQTLTQLAPVGIVQLDREWTCEYANDMWCQLTGQSLELSLGIGWIDVLYDKDRAQLLSDMRHTLLAGGTYRQTVRLDPMDKRPLWVSLNASGMMNALQELTGSLIVIMDVTEKYLAERRLTHITHHDALTGLLNRTSFLEQLHRSLDERKSQEYLALLLIDLDSFKAVNDTLGHDAGDDLLKQVALRIRQNVQDTDIAARLGGDEFTVTLSHLNSEEEAGYVAETIVNALEQPFLLQKEEVYVSASVGIAIACGRRSYDSREANSLIKQADMALNRAKLSGRSRYVSFTPELDQAQRDHSVMITSLRRAVDRQDFELYYQPQMLIKEQRLLGFEALLRWPQENGKAISPGGFIDVLEETGLIGELGEWAINQACCQHRIWLKKGLISPATTMSVNVSARQLGMPDFTQCVAEILHRHAMRPDNLILEITESALVQTIESNIISDIKQLGVQFSLDDFGTGYSSLAYLSQLPLDHLKIDRSFINDITRFPHATTVIKSIIALANTLGIRVIAEGVEESEVLPLLAKEGCLGYQGFYFSRPLPAYKMAAQLQHIESVRLSHYANFFDLGESGLASGE